MLQYSGHKKTPNIMDAQVLYSGYNFFCPGDSIQNYPKIQQVALNGIYILIDIILDKMEKIIPLVLLCLFIASVTADCPLSPYPRRTILGYVDAEINNDPKAHDEPTVYTYALSQQLLENGVSVALGIVGFEVNAHNQLDFLIEHLPSTLLTSLKFRVRVTDRSYGWRLLRFSFFVTQSFMFQANFQTTNQFSTGLQNGKYAVYRPIANFNNFQVQPVIKIFLSGVTLKAKPFDEQYNTMVSQYEGFKKFSNNNQLIAYFAQAIQIKKSLFLKISEAKTLGRLFTFNIETNSELVSISFSYILFGKKVLTEMHNYIADDFSIVNGNQYKFSSLQNMDMLMTGLTGFKIPRNDLYSFSLGFSNLGGQGYYSAISNYKYLDLFFAYIAFQMKLTFVCQDCPLSPIIYDNRFCVQKCPRGYSLSQGAGLKFCDRCDIEKLKVVDPQTGTCVCAKRHYYDAASDTCKPCSYDCMTCYRPDRCLTCDNSLLQTKRKITSAGRCQCPATKFYDDKPAEDIVCQKCNSDCLTCNGPRDHDCLTCEATKQIDSNSFCVCKNGLIQDASGNCICPPPRTLNDKGICFDAQTSCGPNKVEQFVDLTRRCVCKPDFIAVLDDCIKCGANSVFSQQTLKCECVKSTVLVGGECKKCGTNQVYDDIFKTCVCGNGSFKAQDGTCVKCPPKMALFNDKCECIFNYYQSSPGVCKRCIRQTDGPKCKRNLF